MKTSAQLFKLDIETWQTMIFQESITTAGSPILLFMVNLLSVMIQLTYKPVASFRVLHPGHSKKKTCNFFLLRALIMAASKPTPVLAICLMCHTNVLFINSSWSYSRARYELKTHHTTSTTYLVTEGQTS